jgi:hypothetical protein
MVELDPVGRFRHGSPPVQLLFGCAGCLACHPPRQLPILNNVSRLPCPVFSLRFRSLQINQNIRSINPEVYGSL